MIVVATGALALTAAPLAQASNSDRDCDHGAAAGNRTPPAAARSRKDAPDPSLTWLLSAPTTIKP